MPEVCCYERLMAQALIFTHTGVFRCTFQLVRVFWQSITFMIAWCMTITNRSAQRRTTYTYEDRRKLLFMPLLNKFHYLRESCLYKHQSLVNMHFRDMLEQIIRSELDMQYFTNGNASQDPQGTNCTTMRHVMQWLENFGQAFMEKEEERPAYQFDNALTQIFEYCGVFRCLILVDITRGRTTVNAKEMELSQIQKKRKLTFPSIHKYKSYRQQLPQQQCNTC